MLPSIKNILMATDFSRTAWQAMQYASALGLVHGARVYCLHVMPELPHELKYSSGNRGFYDLGPGMAGVPPTSSSFYAKSSQDRQQQEQEAQKKLQEQARDHLKNLIIKLRAEESRSQLNTEDVLIRAGGPVRVILQEVDSGNYDLLVMGRRGHGKLRGPRVGGVAQGVLNFSSIPVLSIGKPADKTRSKT